MNRYNPENPKPINLKNELNSALRRCQEPGQPAVGIPVTDIIQKAQMIGLKIPITREGSIFIKQTDHDTSNQTTSDSTYYVDQNGRVERYLQRSENHLDGRVGWFSLDLKYDAKGRLIYKHTNSYYEGEDEHSNFTDEIYEYPVGRPDEEYKETLLLHYYGQQPKELLRTYEDKVLYEKLGSIIFKTQAGDPIKPLTLQEVSEMQELGSKTTSGFSVILDLDKSFYFFLGTSQWKAFPGKYDEYMFFNPDGRLTTHVRPALGLSLDVTTYRYDSKGRLEFRLANTCSPNGDFFEAENERYLYYEGKPDNEYTVVQQDRSGLKMETFEKRKDGGRYNPSRFDEQN